jgi:hypothetical protein
MIPRIEGAPTPHVKKIVKRWHRPKKAAGCQQRGGTRPGVGKKGARRTRPDRRHEAARSGRRPGRRLTAGTHVSRLRSPHTDATASLSPQWVRCAGTHRTPGTPGDSPRTTRQNRIFRAPSPISLKPGAGREPDPGRGLPTHPAPGPRSTHTAPTTKRVQEDPPCTVTTTSRPLYDAAHTENAETHAHRKHRRTAEPSCQSLQPTSVPERDGKGHVAKLSPRLPCTFEPGLPTRLTRQYAIPVERFRRFGAAENAVC